MGGDGGGLSAQTFTTLHTFTGTDGGFPLGALVQAPDGNLYGITGGGGTNNNGTVFKISPSGALTTLYR
ncbi:MAG: choice-of-anchor tandem repeat GloVer-containing protein, partial [Bryobacteraceae bacterium]